MEFILNILATIAYLLVIIIIIFKLADSYSKLEKVKSNNKYVQILEKIMVSSDSYILVIKLGDTGVVNLVSKHNTILLKELSKDDVDNILLNKKSNHVNHNIHASIMKKLKVIKGSNYGKVKEK